MFEFAHLDEIIDRDPIERLKSVKVQRQPPDPYTVAEAEAVIRSMRKVRGEFDANYVEFGFFAGARPSELIALRWKRWVFAHKKLGIRYREPSRCGTRASPGI